LKQKNIRSRFLWFRAPELKILIQFKNINFWLKKKPKKTEFCLGSLEIIKKFQKETLYDMIHGL